MKTVSFSLDQDTIDGIERFAKIRKVSKSDIVRELFARKQLEISLEKMRIKATPLLEELKLHTEEDIALYAKSKP